MKIVRIACLLVLFALAGCKAPDKGIEPTGWQAFDSVEGRFSVNMPAQPTPQVQKLSSKTGEFDTHLFQAQDGPTTYIVAYVDYPEETLKEIKPEKVLDGARDGAVANIKGKLLSEMNIKIDGYPGREIRVASLDGSHVVRARLILVKNRLYQVLAATSERDAYRDEITQFLDSFQLTKD